MQYTAYQSSVFQKNVTTALETIAKILDTNRKPRLAEDVDHQYDDKYALAEFLTNTNIAAQMNILERMGLSDDKLNHLYKTVKEDRRSVTICLQAQDSCTFEKEQEVDVVKQDTEYQVETSSTSTSKFLTSKSKKKLTGKLKVVAKVREYHWKISHKYRIFCYTGNDPDKDCVELLSRTASSTIATTGSKDAPLPELTIHDSNSTDLTWMLQKIKYSKEQRVCDFKIDRSVESCRTPRRNKDIEKSLGFFNSLSAWFRRVALYLHNRVENNILQSHSPANPDEESDRHPRLKTIASSEVFCPIAPLMEPSQETAGTATRQETPRSLLVLPSPSIGSAATPLLSLGDIDMLLNEQCRTLDESLGNLAARFPSQELSMKLITIVEASVVLYASASKALQSQYVQSIAYIEELLRKQLIAAVGKEVHQQDFHDFMKFHCSKFMSSRFAPKPFSYAIRRGNHSPEGILSIEASNIGDTTEPISTHVRYISGDEAPAISIPINAATSVEMTGHRYLHGWINHRFESSSKTASYTLSGRARQFSSFILMVGTVAGADKFVPKNAVILQNKDEVLIPLLLNELPTAKEFKDAIASLSPEQQRFATAYRGMQLESSVFGICIVQLKPQLEALLDLPPGGLTKEIRLTQDLMSLFVDYQIPSDLLSFDGDPDATLKARIGRVKEHTDAVLRVIEEAKKSDLKEMATQAAHNESRLKAAMSSSDDFALYCTSRDDFTTPSPRTDSFGFMSASAPVSDDDDFFGAAESANVESLTRQREVLELGNTSVRKSRNLSTKSIKYSPSVFRQSFFISTASAPGPVDSIHGVTRSSQSALPSREEPSRKVAQSHTHSNTISNRGNPTSDELGTDLPQGGVVDFSQIPKQLDLLIENHYANEGSFNGALRATIIKASPQWKRWRQKDLLSKLTESKLDESEQKSETSKAFDLLDAITRSGALPIAFGELHVVVGVTHCFENDVMGTVLQDNINPIEKVEKSILLVASSIHGLSSPKEIIAAGGPHSARLDGLFPEAPSLLEGDLP